MGYKWYDEQRIDPLFEFGYGLSYTHFAYSDMAVDHVVDKVNGKITSTVSATITNDGGVAGAEIPQVYVTLPESAEEPGKRLVGFDRVALAPGESERISIVVDSTASNQPYSIWDTEADQWVVLDGEYGISVGASSRDIRLTDSVLVDRVAPTIASVTLDKRNRVVIEGADELSGVGSIEYRIEKNKTATEWVQYAGPFQVDSASTISIRIIDNAGNVSEVQQVTRKSLR